MEEGGREIRILNFAVSVASKNKNERFSGAQFLPDLRCTGHTASDEPSGCPLSETLGATDCALAVDYTIKKV